MKKKFILLVLVACNLFILREQAYAQKIKITNAQLALQDGKVMDAKKEIDAALQNDEIQKMSKAWFTKGDVYKNIYETKLFYAQNPNCLFEAKDAYLKAYEVETNPKKQKDVAAPLTTLSGYLFNEGYERFNAKKYDDAYRHFDASRAINDFLLSKGLSSSLDTNTIFATAMAGANSNKTTEIQPLLEKLVEMNYNSAAVYETLAQIYDLQKNKEALAKITKAGLQKYPGNKNLSVYDLNTSLDAGDWQKSIDKFEKAFAENPKDASMAYNLGVLYDKLQQQEKARASYEKAIELKPDYGDAYYNLGVIYFNAGVELNKKMNALEDKDDPGGKKYAAYKVERDALFQKALPNLEKAYSIDPKNPDYKANLKKVYASMNMLEKAKALSEE
jgi:tetratricopeptide (TPR) repeat protein